MSRTSKFLCSALVGCAVLMSLGAWARGGGHPGFSLGSHRPTHFIPLPLRQLPRPPPR